MQLKPPSGDIFGWSIFWLVCGLFVGVVGLIRFEIELIVAGIVGVTVVALIWLDQKWIAPPVMILYVLEALARLAGLALKGVTLLGVLRMLLPLYFAYLLWEWYRSEREAPVLATSGSSRSPTSPFDKSPGDDRLSNPYQGSHPDEQ